MLADPIDVPNVPTLPEHGPAYVIAFADHLMTLALKETPCTLDAEWLGDATSVTFRLRSNRGPFTSRPIGEIPSELFRGMLARMAVTYLDGQLYGGAGIRRLRSDGVESLGQVSMSNQSATGFWLRVDLGSAAAVAVQPAASEDDDSDDFVRPTSAAQFEVMRVTGDGFNAKGSKSASGRAGPPLVSLYEQWRCTEVRELLHGTTFPHSVIAKRESDGATRPFVMKFRDVRGVAATGTPNHCGSASLAGEIVSSFLARALDLPVPDFAVIQVDPAILQATFTLAATRTLLKQNIGPNFGCVLVQPSEPWTADGPVRRGDPDMLARTIAFDLLMINGDRHGTKHPNILRTDNSLLLIDHGVAMHTALDIGPRELTTGSVGVGEWFVTKHIAFPIVRGRGYDFRSFFDDWGGRVTTPLLEAICAQLPKEWGPPDYADDVLNFLVDRTQLFDRMLGMLERATG